MRPKVLRIRFWPLKEIAIYVPRCGPRGACPGARPKSSIAVTSPRAARSAVPAARRTGPSRRQRPGAREPSRPGSTISIFSAAPLGRRCALSKVVADHLPYFDSRTRIFKLLFNFCCFFFVDALLDRLGRRLDEVLGLLEAELSDRAHFLDDVDFFLADRSQDNIELGLLGRRFRRRRCAAASPRHRDRRRRRAAPLLFDHLGQFGRLDHGQRRQIVDELCQISHVVTPACALGVVLKIHPARIPVFGRYPSFSPLCSEWAATTRASCPAGVCSNTASLVAGALSSPMILLRSSSSDG